MLVVLLPACEKAEEGRGLPSHGSPILKDYVKVPLDRAKGLQKSLDAQSASRAKAMDDIASE